MTTTEISAALRPFYFSVHPDLFGQFPNQRVSIHIFLNFWFTLFKKHLFRQQMKIR